MPVAKPAHKQPSPSIFTEQDDIHPDTLANLGPLRGLAGVWEGQRGMDLPPDADPQKKQAFFERIELQPIDPQSNGPQLFYGLRYHTHITKPREVETYHDQVGYWLWEPATGQIIHTLTIPRGQVAMAGGKARASASQFKLAARAGDPHWGISSQPFLQQAFRTVRFSIEVTVHADDTWSYAQDTVIKIMGRRALFHHIDRNTLHRVGRAKRNPLARGAR